MNSELSVPSATNLTYDSSTNTTHVLGSATVGGNLTVGLLTINDMDASINSMGETLKLQSLGLSNIEFMGGKIIIDTQGNLKVAGEITAEKINIDTREPVSASAGSAIILAGETEIEVVTSALTLESLVFVTPEDEPVAVATQKSGADKFFIKISAPLITELKVSWWIIN